jgi:hypothetical protein
MTHWETGDGDLVTFVNGKGDLLTARDNDPDRLTSAAAQGTQVRRGLEHSNMCECTKGLQNYM